MRGIQIWAAGCVLAAAVVLLGLWLLLSPGWAVNDFKPDEVEALEVYRGGLSSLPVEYGMGGRSSCGLVMVWLKGFVQAEGEN